MQYRQDIQNIIACLVESNIKYTISEWLIYIKKIPAESNKGPPRTKWSGWDAPLVDEVAPEFISIMREMCMCQRVDLVKSLTLLDDRLRYFLK